MLNFNDFVNERWGIDVPVENRRAAGIALIYDNKILLLHPTNSSWKKSTCGIPKGKLEQDEDPFDGALRELEEETSIRLDPQQVDPNPHRVDFYNKKNEADGFLIYYVCRISDLSEIGLSSERLSKSQLQLEEVDWGKFVSAEEAYPIISRSQMIILDRHLTIDQINN
jgi:8-oxo-dGTP pyrophosphatase MutT (NUDIX family)